jgi:hypothetical protein
MMTTFTTVRLKSDVLRVAECRFEIAEHKNRSSGVMSLHILEFGLRIWDFRRKMNVEHSTLNIEC